jgi:hypothetical protein
MMILITGRRMHVGFQMNQMNMTEPMCLCSEYLIHYKSTNGAVLDQIITGDETLLHHVTCYTEEKDRLHGMETHLFSSKKKKVQNS